MHADEAVPKVSLAMTGLHEIEFRSFAATQERQTRLLVLLERGSRTKTG